MAAVGRFAPSPSGRMHLGNVFAALMAWLSTKSEGGEFVLRIEDLDPQRCRPEWTELVRRDLENLGLEWDSEATPQSLRTDAYSETFDRLDKMGLVYPCYCTRGELHAASAPHGSDGTPVYAGTCRNLTPQQRALQTRIPAMRIKVPDTVYGLNDGLQGAYSENLSTDCGDFILRRSDGVYAYQLAVVVDDIAAGVTQIVRGRDLLGSVPRQMYMYELLGAPVPEYYHVPLLVAEDGRRLSKRDRDLELGELLKRHSPQEITGALLFAAGVLDRNEALSPREALSEFAWSRVRREDLHLTGLD